MGKVTLTVEQIEPVTMSGNRAVAARDLMSPYVWQERDGSFGMLVRAVPKMEDGGYPGDTGRIWYATSRDGLKFEAVGARPVIAPGPDADDAGGCEDPTPVFAEDGSVVIYYTGVDKTHSHGEMLYATGPSLDRLTKRGSRALEELAPALVEEDGVIELLEGARVPATGEFGPRGGGIGTDPADVDHRQSTGTPGWRFR